MKRPILSAIALLAIAAAPAAAQKMGPPKSGEGMLSGITLTGAQQKSVDSLWKMNQPERDKMHKEMESGQKPDSAQMAMMKATGEKNMASYRSILTPDQQAVFDKNVTAMKAKMGSMGAGQMAAPKQ